MDGRDYLLDDTYGDDEQYSQGSYTGSFIDDRSERDISNSASDRSDMCTYSTDEDHPVVLSTSGSSTGAVHEAATPSGRGALLWRFHLTTHGVTELDVPEFKRDLSAYCKKWCFQLEKAPAGGLHFQARISLREKKRLQQCIRMFPGSHVSIETNAAGKSGAGELYVMKSDTRVAGPWTDKDVVLYRDPIYDIGSHLRPWQKEVMRRLAAQDERGILIVVDADGNNGKTVLSHYIVQYCEGRYVPPHCQTPDEISQFVHGLCKSGQQYTIVIDLPRAALLRNIAPRIFSAFETIKSGYLYDKRYGARYMYIKPPKIVVFCNTTPDQALLTADRWDLMVLPWTPVMMPMPPPPPSPIRRIEMTDRQLKAKHDVELACALHDDKSFEEMTDLANHISTR